MTSNNDQTEEQLGEDPKILEDIARATGQLEHLLRQHEVELDYAEADWRDTKSLIEESHKLILRHPGWSLYYVSGDEFGIDSNYVFFASKPVDESVILELGRLIVDEGAELPGETPIVCPKCRHEIECLIGSYPASVPAKACIVDGQLYTDSIDTRISDCIDGEVETWHCPDCDEVLFDTKDPDYLDKMEAFLKGGD